MFSTKVRESRSSLQSWRSVAAIGAIGVVLAGGVQTASAEISPVVLNVRATNANGTGEFSAMIEAGQFNPDGSYSWTLAAPREILSATGELIGTLTSGNTFIIQNPLVSIGFSVQAGGLDTTFQITSALLSFAAISSPDATASATITGTDLTSNGVTLTGLHGGAMARTQYNGLVPAGTTYADLIPGPVGTATPGGSQAANDFTMSIIGASVSSISMQYFFSVTAGDIASGTGVFVVVPGPGTIGVLALAGLVGARRRRR